jgi:hypothetical protein
VIEVSAPTYRVKIEGTIVAAEVRSFVRKNGEAGEQGTVFISTDPRYAAMQVNVSADKVAEFQSKVGQKVGLPVLASVYSSARGPFVSFRLAV